MHAKLVRFITMLLATLALLGGVPAAAQLPAADGKLNVPAHLEAETDRPAPGKTVMLAIVMEPSPGWHGYWQNPGDAGVGMQVDWTLPDGVTAGALRYPVPETLLISGIMNHVYEDEYAVLVPLTLPGGLAQGSAIPVRAKANWLSCTREVCVPESDTLAIDLVVGDGAPAADRRTRFDAFRAALPRPLGSDAHFTRAGDRFRIAIPYPESAAISDPHLFPVTPDALRYAADQSFTRSGDQLVMETEAGSATPDRIDAVLKIGKDKGLSFTATPGKVPTAGVPLAGPGEGAGGGDGGGGGSISTFLLALGGAILGGLLLNIMPCVFPLLSLKALSLAKAGESEAQARRDALAYSAGVIIVCLGLGAILLALRAGGASVGWAFQLQDPRVILFLLLLTTGIALNLAGLFEIGGLAFGDRLARSGGVAGSFWTGALAAFVGTPCTGPFMGAALGAALVLPLWGSLAIFAGLGIGLALPFLLLGFVPALRRRLPRPGAWMATFRRILSLPMFATALGLAWLLGRQNGTNGLSWGVAMALGIGLCLWWLGQRQSRLRSGAPIIAPILCLMLAGILLLPAPQERAAAETAGALAAQPFSEAALASARTSGKPVFLYFTADWCLSCKANEAAAIDTDAVATAFRTADVTTLVGDWTNGDPNISRFLEAHGRSGVPLYLFYPAGGEARVLPQLLTPGTLTALVARS